MSKKLLSLLLVLVMIVLSISVISAQDDTDPLGIRDDDRFSWDSLEAFEGYDMGGEEVIWFGPWGTGDQESLNNVLAYFNSAVTNGSVTYIGSDAFEQQIVIDIQGGNPPNLAAFPQPGLAANMAARGGLVPLSDDMRQSMLDNYAGGEGWVNFATYADENSDDQFYGVWYNVNLKSLVWYVPEIFEESGYEIPQSWDELIALADQIVADGGTPFCLGLGSDAATGWPATDWVEDIMLRTAGLEAYADWVSNDMKFTDEAVINAIELFGSVARNPDYVVGGPEGVQTIDFRDSPGGLFTVPPECYMHRQASFIPAFFPDDVEVGVDADFFYFPPIDEAMGRPVLGGGTVVTITKDSPGSQKLMEFLLTPIAHELWAAQPGFLSPHLGMNLDTYSSDVVAKQGEIMLGADVFGFDASDLMPGAIGAGAFWTGMIDYVGGESAEDVAASIQEVWDGLE